MALPFAAYYRDFMFLNAYLLHKTQIHTRNIFIKCILLCKCISIAKTKNKFNRNTNVQRHALQSRILKKKINPTNGFFMIFTYLDIKYTVSTFCVWCIITLHWFIVLFEWVLKFSHTILAKQKQQGNKINWCIINLIFCFNILPQDA